ncbi:integrase_H2C2 domain-containing protein [Trichonephila clavipes]|uniref:Integrase_H2C2 domain-containing protein n=1 Tax=Trichonephila clavipes TaxID=2585209 RepID=A0A8X6RDW9_TRICX|nr:integrase_H2C2 domain-containing protein [Trichonephila clavipes]
MTDYVLRFCNNIKRNSPKLVNSLSSEEIQMAEETLIKIMQSEWPSEIRENTIKKKNLWIPKDQRVVRAILRQCIKCKRLTAGKVNPYPAPLPPDRIHRDAAFQITGADLAGPLSLRGASKAYIVVFTCAVYRAVLLELVSSLSTESFMQALRRFWARRGRVSTRYTDNGTNFVGAANA